MAGSAGGAGGDFSSLSAGTAGTTAQAGQQINEGLFPFSGNYRWQVGGGGGGGAGGGNALQIGGVENVGGGGAGGASGGNGRTETVFTANPYRAGGGGGGGGGSLNGGAPGSGGAGQGGVVAIRILGITVTNYTVTYDATGGSVTPASATFAVGGSPLTLPTPTRSGFTFDGWFTQAVGGTRVGGGGDSYSPVANGTLYAQWTSTSPVPGPPGPSPSNGSGSTSGSEGPERRPVNVDATVLDNLDRSVPTGQASVVVGGTATATAATTVDGADAVTVGGAGWSVQVARSPLVASTRPAGSPLLIAAGGEVRITATGFSPGSSLLVALQPTGALLGTVSVDAQGRADGLVSVPSDSLVGDSTLQVAGILPGLQVAGVAIGLLVERSAVLASRQAAKVVMIGARTDTARLSRRGQRKVRTQLGLIDQAASNVERVIVTAYPTKAEARAEEKAAGRARARSTAALISDSVLPQTPVTRTRVGSITQHPERSGKVMVTVVYRE